MRKRPLAICVLLTITGLVSFMKERSIYHGNWIDLNKNGKKDIYEDPAQPAEERIDDLLGQMTLEEKTCQLATLYG